ncbi:hypothetical protein CN498_20575 [Bacillus thuringiensis]|uniref:hypothetical protein n=1 Tax=Bacillus cereus group TaxID=86661 RepID=UPI00016B629D|nr:MULTISPECIES: hypothetical protein [Bacillus cereus group]MDR4134416.1 hypothetical protein [Bacillus cereus]MDR4366372.1 hypothetical protein [Bacillus cereus]PER85597.1 hypothetical protein CN498_20575 [Bacillus thuringiensis]PGS26353.1 hypothetical protein COC65_26945 [Bacillus thuringiensis]
MTNQNNTAWINEKGNIEMSKPTFNNMVQAIENHLNDDSMTLESSHVYCCTVTCGPNDEKKVPIKLPKALAFLDCLRRALGGCSVQFDDRGQGCQDDS